MTFRPPSGAKKMVTGKELVARYDIRDMNAIGQRPRMECCPIENIKLPSGEGLGSLVTGGTSELFSIDGCMDG